MSELEEKLALVREAVRAEKAQGRVKHHPLTAEEVAEHERRYEIQVHPRYIALLSILGQSWSELTPGGLRPERRWSNAPWLYLEELELPVPYGPASWIYGNHDEAWWEEVFPAYREFALIGEAGDGNEYALRREGEFFGPSVWFIDHECRDRPDKYADDVVEWLLGEIYGSPE